MRCIQSTTYRWYPAKRALPAMLYAWQIGPFWQDTLDMSVATSNTQHAQSWLHTWNDCCDIASAIPCFEFFWDKTSLYDPLSLGRMKSLCGDGVSVTKFSCSWFIFDTLIGPIMNLNPIDYAGATRFVRFGLKTFSHIRASTTLTYYMPWHSM